MARFDWEFWKWFALGAAVAGALVTLGALLSGCGGAEFTLDPASGKLENPGFQAPETQPIQQDSGPQAPGRPQPAATEAASSPPPAATALPAPPPDAGARQDPPAAQDAGTPPPEAAPDAGPDTWTIPLPVTPDASPAVDAAARQAYCNAAACQTSADCQSWCPQPEQGYQFCCTATASAAGRCYMSSAVCP